MQEIEKDISFEYTDEDCYYDPYYFDEYGSCVCDYTDGDIACEFLRDDEGTYGCWNDGDRLGGDGVFESDGGMQCMKIRRAVRNLSSDRNLSQTGIDCYKDQVYTDYDGYCECEYSKGG